MGWEAGVLISAVLLVMASPVIAGAYLLARLPVNRVIGPERPVLRRVVAVIVVLVVGKVLFSLGSP